MSQTAEILKPFGEFECPGKQESVIDLLKTALEQAERGELIGVALAKVNAAQEISSNYAVGSAGYARMLGSITIMQHSFCADWDEG
jgi:hypothetical protein